MTNIAEFRLQRCGRLGQTSHVVLIRIKLQVHRTDGGYTHPLGLLVMAEDYRFVRAAVFGNLALTVPVAETVVANCMTVAIRLHAHTVQL